MYPGILLRAEEPVYLALGTTQSTEPEGIYRGFAVHSQSI